MIKIYLNMSTTNFIDQCTFRRAKIKDGEDLFHFINGYRSLFLEISQSIKIVKCTESGQCELPKKIGMTNNSDFRRAGYQPTVPGEGAAFLERSDLLPTCV